MDRRHFLQHTSMGAFMLPFLNMPGFDTPVRMGIIVHSYAHRWNSKAESKRYPGFLNAIDLMEHCYQIGAGGIQVGMKNWDSDFSRKVRDSRERLGLYIEGSIGLPQSPADCAAFEREVVHAKEAGAGVIRTVCLSGRRYEVFHSSEAFKAFKKKSVAALELAEPIVRKHKMKLAVENHKDWRADELVGILQQLNSEWIGVTLDFGNSIALLEHPMEVVEALSPYVFTTHVKDMAVDRYKDGFLLSEVPLGEGILDLAAIFEICKRSNPGVTFNLEMITRDPLKIPCLTDDYWSTLQSVPAKDLARTLRLVEAHRMQSGLPLVSHLGVEDQLATEERNIIESLSYSKNALGMR